jgi:hypothetical protein
MIATTLNPERLRKFEDDLRQVEAKLRPQVVRIRYSFGSDWAGDPAVFFRVVLSDEVSKGENLAEVTGEIGWKVFGDLNFAELDVIPYLNFRTNAEQTKLKDPEWE